ncbi:MAG: hypothetical protein JNK15_13375 [Planctomycetes bacterium]|nr:hypothetical protein [Planctomycetota bacterium]
MTPDLYRLLHVVSLLIAFLGIGGMLAHEAGKAPKLFAALHGIGLLGMVVCGVGLMHKASPAIGWEPWIFAKLGAWVLLGAMPVMVKRGMITRFLALLLTLGIAVGAAGLALVKDWRF